MHEHFAEGTPPDVIRAFEERWKFARGLNIDLLRSLDEADLLFSPGDGVGPLWKQFRHLGRVQQNYLTAMSTGRIVFTSEGHVYSGGPSKQHLLNYLGQLDKDLRAQLSKLAGAALAIDWLGETVAAGEHLMRMVEHELLHQGMFVVAIQLLGKRYPESWRAWGL